MGDGSVIPRDPQSTFEVMSLTCGQRTLLEGKAAAQLVVDGEELPCTLATSATEAVLHEHYSLLSVHLPESVTRSTEPLTGSAHLS